MARHLNARSVAVRVLVSLVVGAVVDGCFAETSPGNQTTDAGSTAGGTGECLVGSAGCPCTGGSGCDEGLTCLSNVCVDASADDSSGDASSDSTGAESNCGNGVVDPDEQCDGGGGCTECVLDDYTCNPYNQVGCAATQTCDRTRGATLQDQRTGCFQEGAAGYAETCEYDPLDPALQCGDRLSCVGSAYVPGCEGLVECCTAFCIIGGDPCTDPMSECLTWKEVGMPPGLDELGLCIRL